MTISRKPRGEIPSLDEMLKALPVVGTLNVDTNTFTPNSEEVLGAEMLTEAIEDVSLDRYLDRSPKLGEPINYPEMVGVLQRKRQMFITAEAKRKSGIKDEGEENVEVTV